MAIPGTLLLGISIAWVWEFVLPARQLKKELSKADKALRDIQARLDGDVVDLEEIKSKAMSVPALSHLWSEYAKTLHPQREDADNGHSRVVRWRATALADTFFSEQAVVDARLKTDFYKHVPGILTGIGIIGTFFGLIGGLSRFKVPKDLTLIQEQLGQLIGSVNHAFHVSAVAIVLAMLFTWFEKWLVTARYRQVESLRESVDKMFEGGAGEEYLARVAMAAETSATQAAQLKDALVSDLKEILSAQITRQIEAQARHSSQMSDNIGEAISRGIGPSMEVITKAVQGVSVNQGEAVNKLLTEVLTSFSAQMRDIFGGQMQGMSDLLRETSQLMKETARQFGQLATNMGTAGTSTVEAMGKKLTEALAGMEDRQQVMNQHMAAFVEQIRALVGQTQAESADKLQEVLAKVGNQVADLVKELHRQAELSAKTQGEHQKGLKDATSAAIGSLSGQMEQLLAQSMATNESLQNSVEQLTNATSNAIQDMNSGAAKLSAAATDFAKAGEGVSKTMEASAAASQTIEGASSQLRQATDNARSLFADHAESCDTFKSMVTALEQTVDNARREASMTAGIIRQIEAAAGELATAQKASEEYLRDLCQVLGEAHTKFADNVVETLRKGNREFHRELSSAVGLLSGAIKDLGDTIEDIPTLGR